MSAHRFKQLAKQSLGCGIRKYLWGLLHKTLTGEKTWVKSENSGKHNFTIDFIIGDKKPPVKITRVFLR